MGPRNIPSLHLELSPAVGRADSWQNSAPGLKKKTYLFLSMRTCVCLHAFYVPRMHWSVLPGQKRVAASPGPGVTGSFEPARMSARNWVKVLWENTRWEPRLHFFNLLFCNCWTSQAWTLSIKHLQHRVWGACVHTCTHMQVHTCTHVCACMWRPEDNLQRYSSGVIHHIWDRAFSLALTANRRVWLAGQWPPEIFLSLSLQG